VITAELLQHFPFHPESVAILSAALDPQYHPKNKNRWMMFFGQGRGFV